MALVSPETIADLAGRQDDAQFDQRATAAVDIVSAMVQSYTHLSFQRALADTVVLEGTPGRKLVLGDPPIIAVSAVAIDGRAVDVHDYRWTRRGVLFRAAGWGEQGSAVTVTYDHGFESVPSDIAAVVRTAALRLAANPEQIARTMAEDFETWFHPPGFSVGELLVLNRYRRRSFP